MGIHIGERGTVRTMLAIIHEMQNTFRHSVLTEEEKKFGDAFLAACKGIRAICGAKRAYDRDFSRAVCENSEVLALGLKAFSLSHDIQVECLELLVEVSGTDVDGAQAVGAVLMDIGGPDGNLPLDTLVKFHSDSDCVTTFKLLRILSAHAAFARSISVFPGGLAEMLRWTGIYRNDETVQRCAMEALAAFLASEAFHASHLLEADGMEEIILSSARHFESELVVRPANAALVALSTRCNQKAFYAALGKTVTKHVSNPNVTLEICRTLSAIFRGHPDRVERFRTSGVLPRFLRSIEQHVDVRGIGDRVGEYVPQIVDLLLENQRLTGLLLDHRMGYILERVVRKQFPATKHPTNVAPGFEWQGLTVLTGAPSNPISCPGVVATAFRAISKLLVTDRWKEVATSELIRLLLRIMRHAENEHIICEASVLLSKIMHIVEERTTWAASGSPVQESSTEGVRRKLARRAREAHKAQTEAFKQWKDGHFSPAAACFRSATKFMAELRQLCQQAGHECSSLVEHMNRMPFEKYASCCQEQQRIFASATNGVITTQRDRRVSALGDEECCVCMELLRSGETTAPLLWQCRTCHKYVHQSCLSRWRATRNAEQQTCPFCREPVQASSDMSDYNDAHSIAQAVEAVMSWAQDGQCVVADAFFGAACAKLWRTTVRHGELLGAQASMLTVPGQRASMLEACSKAKLNESREKPLTWCVDFEKQFVVPLENLRREQEDTSDLNIAGELVGTFAEQVLRQRCGTLTKEAAQWEESALQKFSQGMLQDGLRLLSLAGTNISLILDLASAARLPPSMQQPVSQHLEDILAAIDPNRETNREMCERFQIVRELRMGRAPDASTGNISAPRRNETQNPVASVLQKNWGSGRSLVASLCTMRSVNSTFYVVQSAMSQGNERGRQLSGPWTQLEAGCKHIMDASLKDSIPASVGRHLREADARRRINALLAVDFFGLLMQCGNDSLNATFSQVENGFRLLAQPWTHGDQHITEGVCSFLGELIFRSDCEENVLRFLHTISSSASTSQVSAATPGHQFLEHMLAKYHVEHLRDAIQNHSARDWSMAVDTMTHLETLLS
jgi:hypothetical protein